MLLHYQMKIGFIGLGAVPVELSSNKDTCMGIRRLRWAGERVLSGVSVPCVLHGTSSVVCCKINFNIASCFECWCTQKLKVFLFSYMVM